MKKLYYGALYVSSMIVGMVNGVMDGRGMDIPLYLDDISIASMPLIGIHLGSKLEIETVLNRDNFETAFEKSGKGFEGAIKGGVGAGLCELVGYGIGRVIEIVK
ncbi:MAG: hypothetical protein AABW46_00085 [Nanoarchaeota archaeon]